MVLRWVKGSGHLSSFLRDLGDLGVMLLAHRTILEFCLH